MLFPFQHLHIQALILFLFEELDFGICCFICHNFSHFYSFGKENSHVLDYVRLVQFLHGLAFIYLIERLQNDLQSIRPWARDIGEPLVETLCMKVTELRENLPI